MIVDLHAHSDLSDDSRASVEAYLKWLRRKRDVLPFDGIVLTEHRQWDPQLDYRALEDRYGFLVLRGAEIETDYGHMLVYGVNEEIVRRFDFADTCLPAQSVVNETKHFRHVRFEKPLRICMDGRMKTSAVIYNG